MHTGPANRTLDTLIVWRGAVLSFFHFLNQNPNQENANSGLNNVEGHILNSTQPKLIAIPMCAQRYVGYR